MKVTLYCLADGDGNTECDTDEAVCLERWNDVVGNCPVHAFTLEIELPKEWVISVKIPDAPDNTATVEVRDVA